MAAAVADAKPVNASTVKIKKARETGATILSLSEMAMLIQ
jgi:phosphopantothenoylcysteine synthetase/decarboxylase